MKPRILLARVAVVLCVVASPLRPAAGDPAPRQTGATSSPPSHVEERRSSPAADGLTPAAPTNGAGFHVVQIIAAYQEYDPFLPWQGSAPNFRVGYGAVVQDSCVLTTESLVRNQKLVELRKPMAGKKIQATVQLADAQANLALLKIRDEDKDDLADLAPLAVATNGNRNDTVKILQFDATSQIQEGEGRVVQVAMMPLPQAPYESLVFQVLTDLNVNGEGAVAVSRGKLAGLLLSYDASTRTGLMLPYPVVRQFLNDAAEPPYNGFASAGFVWSSLVDPVKRAFLKVPQPRQGILVLQCVPGTGAAGALKPNDVILSLDGRPVDDMGFYEDPVFGRLGMSYLIRGIHRPGDKIPVAIIRDGVRSTVSLELTQWVDAAALIPENVTGEQEEYLVEGGLILRELTGRYLRGHGPDWQRSSNPRLVHYYLTRGMRSQQPGEHVVILSSILPDPVNIGYQQFGNEVVTHVNGEAVRSMEDVFRVAARDRSIYRVRMLGSGTELVLPQQDLADANLRLARLYGLPAMRFQRSAP